MASETMPEELMILILEELPPLPERTENGGRKPIAHHVVLRVIWHVLSTGCRWVDVPKELGCCGETARTRLRDWQAAGVWDRVHHRVLQELNRLGKLHHETAVIDSTLARAFGGGDESGPNPTDRGKPGVKYTLLVDRQGVPLAVRTAGANRSDHKELLRTTIEFPRLAGRAGRPREMPKELLGDAGYDSEAARAVLRWLGIEPKIRRRGSEHGSHLGVVRWVVERTVSWFKGLRRLRFRYDRSQQTIAAWAKLAAVAVSFRFLSS